MPQIKIKEPKTDQWKTIRITETQFQSLLDLNTATSKHAKLLSEIEKLNTSTDIKKFLETVLNFTIDVSNKIIKVGSKIIEIIISVSKHFPKATIGLVVGLVIGKIISKIPILGWALNWVITPLSAIVGVAIGAKNDLEDKDLVKEAEKKIDTMFAGIKDIKV